MVIFLAVLGIIAFLVSIGLFIWLNIGVDNRDRAVWKYKQWTPILPILGLVFAFFALGSPAQVGAGERGVLLHFGAVTSTTYDEGLYFKLPIVQSVRKMDVTTQALQLDIASATRDVQDANLVVTVSYRLDPSSVNQIWQRFRGGHEARIVIPFTQDAVKSATPLYDAEELVVNRPNVRESAVEALRKVLSDNFMLLENVAIENIAFTDEFSASLERKAIAATEVDTAKNRQLQAEVEAETARIAAEGEANASFARADGEARSITRIASAQSEANELLDQSLTDQLIQWRTVDKLADDIKVIILPSGEEFILGPEVLGR